MTCATTAPLVANLLAVKCNSNNNFIVGAVACSKETHKAFRESSCLLG